MSMRLFASRLLGHGRAILVHSIRRHIHQQPAKGAVNILERQPSSGAAVAETRRRSAAAQLHHQTHPARASLSSSNLFRFGQHARRLFVDSILRRVAPVSSASRPHFGDADATRKLLLGDSQPFLSLLGVSLATGSILSRDDELEGVCWEIREAVSRLQGNWGRETVSAEMSADAFGLDRLDIGPAIAKGCAAVVYAAAIKTPAAQADGPKTVAASPPGMSPIQNTSRFVHNFGSSTDLTGRRSASTTSLLVDEYQRSTMRPQTSVVALKRSRYDSLAADEPSKKANRAASAAVQTHNDRTAQSMASATSTDAEQQQASADDLQRYPFALKMMFNYDIQSNAMAILRAMYKETIPARNKRLSADADSWERIFQQQTVDLPPHPNIVLMFGVFCDQIPNLAPGASLYPMALPPRLNPNGYGRNMSLFLLMKRYHYRLCDYLAERAETLALRTRILMFAQLLEAIAHLHRHGVAHRDLKSDNVLIDLNDDVHPVVVLSDFGCCLADRRHGLQLPYTSADIDKGGNAALMAPEIYSQQPGTFSILDYGKADLWSIGTLAYEIFGMANPFYGGTADATGLRNGTYRDEQLPALPADVPFIVRALVENVLQRNARRRLQPDIAANVMQLFLWAPSAWLRPDGNPSSTEILQWLLSLTTKVLCERRVSADGPKMSAACGDLADGANGTTPAEDAFGYRMGRRTYTEYLLLSSFLVRARLDSVRTAMSWIQNVVAY